jgi:hypothetical protein
MAKMMMKKMAMAKKAAPMMRKSMMSMKMKVVMKKAMKKSIIAKGKLSKVSVFKGFKVKTVGGLTKAHLIKSKTGKIVSKKASLNGKRAYKRIAKWTAACAKAKKDSWI